MLAMAHVFVVWLSIVGSLQQWGTVHEAIMKGNDHGRVHLKDATAPGAYGIGALEGLKGEVIVIDGTAWVSEPAENKGVAREASAADNATLLVIDSPALWINATVEHGADSGAIERTIKNAIEEHVLDSEATRIFFIEAPIAELDVHVINGMCPRKATTDPTIDSNLPMRATSNARVTLVGVYAPNGGGVITHHGELLHMHALTTGATPIVGHVDKLRIPESATIRIAGDTP